MAPVLMVRELMLVGIVNGPEMIRNSRSVTAEHDGFKAAVFAFLDRSPPDARGLRASHYQTSSVRFNGNGDGRIEALATAAAPNGVPEEDVLVWDHLTKAEFVRGGFIFMPRFLTDRS